MHIGARAFERPRDAPKIRGHERHKANEHALRALEEVPVEEARRAAARQVERRRHAEQPADRTVQQLGDGPASGRDHGQARMLDLCLTHPRHLTLLLVLAQHEHLRLALDITPRAFALFVSNGREHHERVRIEADVAGHAAIEVRRRESARDPAGLARPPAQASAAVLAAQGSISLRSR